MWKESSTWVANMLINGEADRNQGGGLACIRETPHREAEKNGGTFKLVGLHRSNLRIEYGQQQGTEGESEELAGRVLGWEALVNEAETKGNSGECSIRRRVRGRLKSAYGCCAGGVAYRVRGQREDPPHFVSV